MCKFDYDICIFKVNVSAHSAALIFWNQNQTDKKKKSSDEQHFEIVTQTALQETAEVKSFNLY